MDRARDAADPARGDPGRSRSRWIVLLSAVAVGIIASVAIVRSGPSGDDQPFDAGRGDSPIDTDRIVPVLGQDGIPSIDEPRFENVSEVDWLDPREPVVAVEIDGDARAYPLQILTWHEIANDSVSDVPVAVTFCPLCNTAYTFVRPEVDGEVTTFGVSGKLYNSNLLMYDRATETLWPQALGVGAEGPLTWMELDRVPSPIVSWEEFRAGFPDGLVLSRETGFDRDYGRNPYPGYDDVDRQPFLFRGEADGRLAAVERVLGVEGEDEIVAFPYFRLEEKAKDGITAVNTNVGSDPVLVMWKEGTVSALDEASIVGSKDVGAAFAYSRLLDDEQMIFDVIDGRIVDRRTGSSWDMFGRAVSGPLKGKKLESVVAHDSFWFDWAAFHPETKVWGNG